MDVDINTFKPDEGAPSLHFIPDQVIPANKFSSIDFSNFVDKHEGEILRYTIEDGPPEFSLDPDTGVYSGTAPNIELNQTYLVTLTVTNVKTEVYAALMFQFEIVGTLLLETEEGRAFFAKEEFNFWEASKNWEIMMFIQHIITEHYAWVVMYDDSKSNTKVGSLIDKRDAKSGWSIYEFENAVMISPGDKAFSEYGNKRRLLDTLREAILSTVIDKEWKSIEIDGSDAESIGKCWVIARELDLPVNTLAPTDIAEINYYNLKKVFAENTPSKPKPQP